MKISNNLVWAAAGSVTAPCPSPFGVVALPAVDGSNLSLLVTNNSSGPAWFVLQTDQTSRFSINNSRTDAIEIAPGAALLFAPGAVADFPNTQAAAATFASVQAPAGGALTFTRGTATAQEILSQ